MIFAASAYTAPDDLIDDRHDVWLVVGSRVREEILRPRKKRRAPRRRLPPDKCLNSKVECERATYSGLSFAHPCNSDLEASNFGGEYVRIERDTHRRPEPRRRTRELTNGQLHVNSCVGGRTGIWFGLKRRTIISRRSCRCATEVIMVKTTPSKTGRRSMPAAVTDQLGARPKLKWIRVEYQWAPMMVVVLAPMRTQNDDSYAMAVPRHQNVSEKESHCPKLGLLRVNQGGGFGSPANLVGTEKRQGREDQTNTSHFGKHQGKCSSTVAKTYRKEGGKSCILNGRAVPPMREPGVRIWWRLFYVVSERVTSRRRMTVDATGNFQEAAQGGCIRI
ncbi:hypothetical protein FB451DRAFT_1175335 [Mycena latifolia]|nr:hypothetical protein FB451DRAFT_1175335 [Mycena latifolia]